ncbi:MAG: DUF402 domain-containing protein [Myxococcota bacterium]
MGRPVLMAYWTDRPWNLHLSWHPDGRLHRWYVNVATPARWDDGVVRWVDLDVDVILGADGRIAVDDEDEFAANTLALGYDDALVAEVRRTTEAVRAAMAAREPPFDDSLVGWLAARG